MKSYKFDDPDYDGYEIEIPADVVRDIILDYLRKTYYWSVGILCFLIGLILGISI